MIIAFACMSLHNIRIVYIYTCNSYIYIYIYIINFKMFLLIFYIKHGH